MSNHRLVQLSSCACSIASMGCRAWDSCSQGLTFLCVAVLLLLWAKSILGRVGETGEIASVIYLTSFAQNCLLGISCLLRPGVLVCVSSAPGSAWRRGATSEHLALLLQIPLCCWGRLTAPRAEPLPLLGQQNGGQKACGRWSGVGDGSSNRRWEEK